ncbi:MAG: hypothetical protein AAFZ65_02965 [Planctomycetota bacterium]
MTSARDDEPRGPHERGHGEQEHGADRRFVDALLQHHFHGDADANLRRVEQALHAIDSSSRPTVAVAMRSPWLQLVRPLVAALVLLALILGQSLLTNSASAEIDRATIAMSRSVDLHYRIEIMTPLGAPLPGEIWFRGTDFVALRLDTAAGATWAGEGRDAAWVVPQSPSRPVRLHRPGDLLDALKLQDDPEAPFFRITKLLKTLSEGYEVEFGADGKTIEARRVAALSGDQPTKISVRLAPDGIVRSLEVEYTPIFGPRGCRMTWLDSADVPASFYEHDAHHAVDRKVIDLR